MLWLSSLSSVASHGRRRRIPGSVSWHGTAPALTLLRQCQEKHQRLTSQSQSSPPDAPSRRVLRTPRPFLPGDFVTTDSGHGPRPHGARPWRGRLRCCASANGIEPVFAVMDDGRYRDDWEWLGAGDLDDEGKNAAAASSTSQFNAPEGPICADLREAGALLSARRRLPAPTRIRGAPKPRSSIAARRNGSCRWTSSTSQSKPMRRDAQRRRQTLRGQTRGTLRTRAMSEIERVRFIPEKGRTASARWSKDDPIGCSPASAPGACRSRCSCERHGRISAGPRSERARRRRSARRRASMPGTRQRKAEFLGEAYNPDDYEMVTDILDVWFDSGCTHAFTLESGRWPDLNGPPTSISKAPTSIAAGSSPRCSKAAPRAAARPMTRC